MYDLYERDKIKGVLFMDVENALYGCRKCFKVNFKGSSVQYFDHMFNHINIHFRLLFGTNKTIHKNK